MKLYALILGITLSHCAFAKTYICYSHDNRQVPEFHSSIELPVQADKEIELRPMVISRNFKPYATVSALGIFNKELVDLDVLAADGSSVGHLRVTANGAANRFSGEFSMKNFSRGKRFFISCMSQEAK